LKLLSTKNNGELSWTNNQGLTKKQIDNAKKQKQLLSEALKISFQINDNPFENYRKVKAYKIKMKLIPENSQNTEEENDMRKDFRQRTPSVYQEEKEDT
jgi:hypothetical protein